MTTGPADQALREAMRHAQRDLKEAYLNFEDGRTMDAIDICRRVAVEHPAHLLAPTLEGAFLLSLGRVLPALALLRKTTQRFPDHPLPRFHFAEALLFAGRIKRARQELDAADALNPGDDLAACIGHMRTLTEGVQDTEAFSPFVVPD